MDVFNRLREMYNQQKELWSEEQCKDRVTAQKHINTWNMAIAIVGVVEREYYEAADEYTGKGTFTAREIRLRELDAIHKQIPHKPEEYEDRYYACKCGNILLPKWEKYPTKLMPKSEGLPYCMACGQKLDWS